MASPTHKDECIVLVRVVMDQFSSRKMNGARVGLQEWHSRQQYQEIVCLNFGNYTLNLVWILFGIRVNSLVDVL
jgi:hypothetical protein